MTPAPATAAIAPRWRAPRTWRLASGTVPLAYLSSHLATHLLGRVSLATAEAGLRVTVAIWHGVPGTVALAAAFGVHLALALRTLATRRNWRLPAVEWAGRSRCSRPDGSTAASASGSCCGDARSRAGCARCCSRR